MHDNLTFQRLSDISVDISCFFLACWRTREFANIYRCYRGGADAQCREEARGRWGVQICQDNTITEQSDEVRCKKSRGLKKNCKRDVSAISTSNLVVVMVTIVIITIVIVIIMTILTMHMRFLFGQICLGSVVSDALNQCQAKQPQS